MLVFFYTSIVMTYACIFYDIIFCVKIILFKFKKLKVKCLEKRKETTKSMHKTVP